MIERVMKKLHGVGQIVFFLNLSMMLATCACGQAQQSNKPGLDSEAPGRLVIEKPLAEGSTVSLTINSGDVRIVRSLVANQIRLEISIGLHGPEKAVAQQRWVKRMDADSKAATVELQLPSDRSAGAVTLYVPDISSLIVKLHEGKLVVSGIKGNKDLSVGAGMLTLREPDPSAYQHVNAEVKLGEVTDEVFHGKQRGLWGRTLVVDGKGTFQLRLHVGTGDLVMTGENGTN